MKGLHPSLLMLIMCICACSRQHPATPPVAEPDYKTGDSFLSKNRDSAYYYFNKVATSSHDSLQVAMAYNNMAGIQADAGDYFGSEESLLMAVNHLNPKKKSDLHCLLSTYNELGSSSLKLKDYDAAAGYFDRALSLTKEEHLQGIILNNKALVYKKKGNYTQAIKIYQQAIELSKKNKREYARTVSNLAVARWLQNPAYYAAPEFWRALQFRKEMKDEWGLNASYAHLSDYYASTNPDSALVYATRMYAIAQQIASPDDELEALQKLITLSPAKASRQYFTLYQHLNDSIQTARNAAKNQFALIRYDVEKNKADNLLLQKDNSEKRYQIIWQRVWLFGIIFVFLLAVVISITWYRKRKQQIIREQQLKASQKIHDVVANGLYRIMAEIEHSSTIETESLLDKIEDLYNQSRDISYEHSGNMHTDFHETVAGLLTSFGTSNTNVLLTGNSKELWNNVKEQAKKELKHILQELMVNMQKHSDARNVVVKFEQQEDHIEIRYTDDGIGVPQEFQYGNGLNNTVSRIKSIGGRITFDKTTTKGLKILVHVPIAKSK